MAEFYFTDRKYNLLGIASTDKLASESIIAIDDIGGQEGDYQSVDGGYRSYSATLHFSPDQSAQVKEMAQVGNFILFKARGGESVWTTILNSEHDPLAGTNTFVAEDASIDLINGTVGAYAASSAMTIAQYIELFAGDSGFVIGYNEIPDLTRTLKWDSDDSSVLTRILSVATQFGVELSFRFEVKGLSVVEKYIDIKKRIGSDKLIYLHVNTEINKIVTTSDIADLCTAIAGTGGTPEGSNDPITLKGYHWIDPNGRYVLGDDGVLRDPVALRTWSRLLSNTNTNPVDAHITRNKTYEATTQATLLQSVLSDLEKFNHPAVNYEVDIAKLPDTVNIGDTVYLVDEDEQLYLSARVLELTYSYSNESGTATLGDYLIQASQVNPAYRELAEQLKNIPKTVQYYPWIRYADDDKGTNMSAFPTGKKYMAIIWSNETSVPSDNPSDYAGHWALIQGKDGADGVPGAKGADGRTSYFHTAWADDVSGQSGFTISGGDGKKYIGTYSDFTQADSTNPADYNWALFKGADGRDGKDGSDNVPVITVGTAYPTGPKKGDMHWLTNSSGVVTGYYTYDGSTWQANKIDASVISAATFNGLTFTGVTFDGSTFMSANSRVIANGEEELYTVGTTMTNTQTLDKSGYTSVAQGSIMGNTTPNSFKATTTIGNTGSIRSRADFASGDWSIITIDPTQSAMTMSNSQNTSGTLNADYLSRVNNCGTRLWTGTLVMNDAQSVTPTLKMSQCLNGWALLWSVFYGNGQNNDSRWFYQYISKNFVEAHSGQGITMVVAAPNGSTNWANNATKYLYFTDSTIKGYTANNQQTGYSYALREVVAW